MTKRSLIAILLVFLGVVQPLGYFFNLPLVGKLGFASAAAPFARVFTSASGYDPMSYRNEIVGETRGGDKLYRGYRHDSSDNISWSLFNFVRSGPLFYTLNWGPIIESALSEKILKFEFCNSDPWNNYFGREDIARVHVKYFKAPKMSEPKLLGEEVKENGIYLDCSSWLVPE